MKDDELYSFPSFFKLVLSPRLCLQKLEIPRKFVENHGEELSDVVHLRTPTQAVWKVDLLRKNNRAWLQNGWPEFVKFYSICHGHFLIFRYKGHSHFDVVIFDMSASEIAYPTSFTRGSLKGKRATGIPISPASNKEDEIVKKVSKMPNLVFGRNCLLTGEEINEVEAYQRGHPSFVIKTVPSHVEFKYNVNLPVEFVRKYLEERGMFTFENATGKTWLVRCTDTTKGEKKSVTFNTGWRGFAQDNKLRVGDICIFELIKGANKLFKVNILPVVTENAGNYPRVKLEVD